MLKRLTLLALCLCLMPSLILAAPVPEDRLAYSLQLFEDVRAGDEQAVLKDMTEDMVPLLKGKIGLVWLQIQGQAGAFEAVGDQKEYEKDGYWVTETQLLFKNLNLMQVVSFDAQGKVAGLQYVPAPKAPDVPPAALPEGLTEQEVTITADERYPLPGTLTLPKGEPLAGFVLVHGSGPNDRDETVGPNKPFRDLAWGLAQQGFAVLRYDKRTFAHGEQLVQQPEYATLTVDEETAQDAAAALKQMQQLPALEGKNIYLAGHSMGAMLASYIGSMAPDTAGYVLLAGTPRKLWEIVAQQNLLALEELPEDQRAPHLNTVEAEKQKALALRNLTDEEALKEENAPFTLSAWYMRHLEHIDTARLHLEDQKPVLILQGENDRQVYMEDFALWKEKLASHPDATFKSYPGLNHLFGKYEGDPVPFSQLIVVEYMQHTPIPEEVIQDIAAWAKERL